MTDDTQQTADEHRPTADPPDETRESPDSNASDPNESDRTEPLEDRVEAALRAVRDPEADVNVFEAGLVENIDVADDAVTVEAAVGEFDHQNAQGVIGAMTRAIRDVSGVESVTVRPVAPSAADRTGGVHGFDTVIAVASAKGGVGKSTVATGLACGLAADRGTGLFDADIHGPNVPTLLGVSGPVRSADDGSPLPVVASGPDADLDVMSVGLMEEGAPLAWRGAMAHDALTELYEDTAWNADDTLVLDLPPGTGDVVLTTLQEVPVDGVVVVTTPFPASLEDTARSVELFRDNGVPVLGVVVNMGSFDCPSCGDSHPLFPEGSPAETLQAPLLAELPFTPELQEAPAPGDPHESMADLADAVAEAAETAWDVDAPEDAVDIRGASPERRRERVAERFTSLQSGEQFALVSDRDPTPVRDYLATVSDRNPDDLADFSVERRTPDDWLLTVTVP